MCLQSVFFCACWAIQERGGEWVNGWLFCIVFLSGLEKLLADSVSRDELGKIKNYVAILSNQWRGSDGRDMWTTDSQRITFRVTFTYIVLGMRTIKNPSSFDY